MIASGHSGGTCSTTTLWNGDAITFTSNYREHCPGCNCGTGDPGCGAPGVMYVVDHLRDELDLELGPVPGPYWPPGLDDFPARPRVPRRTARWREWVHARRHARHDRAPPVMVVA